MSISIVKHRARNISFQSHFNKLPLKTRLEIDGAITKREAQSQSIYVLIKILVKKKKNLK